MLKIEYDFLNWTSFPSSIKLINTESTRVHASKYVTETLPVRKGPITLKVKAKQENVTYQFDSPSLANLGKDMVIPDCWIKLPEGTFDWRDFEVTAEIPYDMAVFVGVHGGTGYPGKEGITWFDDLKIYQNDELIYANDFSNWNPVIGAGIGAPIGGVAGYLLQEPLGPMVSEVVGAVVGGAVGGGVGLLTGLGIVPIPQIPVPTLGATPEESGVPARLGKYLITG